MNLYIFRGGGKSGDSTRVLQGNLSRRTGERFTARVHEKLLSELFQWRFELFVDLNLIAGDHFVCFVGHADDCL